MMQYYEINVIIISTTDWDFVDIFVKTLVNKIRDYSQPKSNVLNQRSTLKFVSIPGRAVL
jgi:hypothetical protein